MTVFVNDKQLILFEGAKVIDALRMYGGKSLKQIRKGKSEVLDSYGYSVDLGGALSEGSRLTVKAITDDEIDPDAMNRNTDD